MRAFLLATLVGLILLVVGVADLPSYGGTDTLGKRPSAFAACYAGAPFLACAGFLAWIGFRCPSKRKGWKRALYDQSVRGAVGLTALVALPVIAQRLTPPLPASLSAVICDGLLPLGTLTLLLYLTLAWMAPPLRQYRRLLRLEKTAGPLCAECGYSLRGNTSGRCSECGQLLPPGKEGTQQASQK